eukprot:423958_1
MTLSIFAGLSIISLCILHFWLLPKNTLNQFSKTIISESIGTVLDHLDILNVQKKPNNTKCPVEFIRHGQYATINGINVSTAQKAKWFSYGFSNNCPNKMSYYNNVSIVNFSTWRGDGLGAQLTETMQFIAISLWKPKYKYYYFPFLFRSEWLHNICSDLREIGSFINIGYNERNILNEPCTCCIWGPKLFDLDPYVKHLRSNQEMLFNETVRQHLRYKYFQNKQNLTVYNHSINNVSIFNVAVHIRRGDVKEAKISRRLLPNEFYIKIMKRLFWNKTELNVSTVYFHIYSQWNFDINKFENTLKRKLFSNMFKHPQFKLKYYLSTDLGLTFHGLVTADALIVSKSSLSKSAALLSKSKYIFHPVRGAMNHYIRCTIRAKCKYPKGINI